MNKSLNYSLPITIFFSNLLSQIGLFFLLNALLGVLKYSNNVFKDGGDFVLGIFILPFGIAGFIIYFKLALDYRISHYYKVGRAIGFLVSAILIDISALALAYYFLFVFDRNSVELFMPGLFYLVGALGLLFLIFNLVFFFKLIKKEDDRLRY